MWDTIQAFRKTFNGTAHNDFLVEVARGKVPGVNSLRIHSSNPRVGNSAFEDVWDKGGNFVYATAAETLELLSSDASDTLLGTGARTVVIRGLDSGFVEQCEIVSLNGTTPVTLTKTYLRTRILIVATVGSIGSNVGTITLNFHSRIICEIYLRLKRMQ